MAKLEIPQFETRKELFDFLVEKKEILMNQKKSSIKYADGFSGNVVLMKPKNSTNKSTPNDEVRDEIKVKAVINTTNLLDSHGDVHIKGIWNKSVKENNRILHVQEHKSNEFDKIIASGEDLKASVKTYEWKELGYDVEGKTEALVFDSVVKEKRNPFMFNQYSKGYVNNHSVGMRYIKMALCVNDENYGAEKEAWDKYIEEVANKEDAERLGYFWAVTEAKAVEGSAVPLGSNPITPTINTKTEPQKTETEIKNEAIMKWLKN